MTFCHKLGWYREIIVPIGNDFLYFRRNKMENELLRIKEEALNKLDECSSLKELNDIRVLYLGKKGPIQESMKLMKNMDPEARKTFGQISNLVKQELSKAVEEKKELLENQTILDKINREKIDITLPSYKLDQGSLHPLSIIVTELEDLFLGMGYQIAEGPEVESDYFNFELMNLPKGHPARDMQDTFYIDENTLMRTHTSPVQAHTLLAAKGKGPIKVICPGKTYRRDDDDATHSHQFMQCEGLVVDKNITMANAVICYNCREGISPKKAENATTMTYLGTFEFELSPEGVQGSNAGLEYMIWIGTTDKSREEFMEYFNQDEYMKEIRDYKESRTKKRPNPEHRCQFCKDINIKYYYPEFLTVEIKDEPENPFNLVRMMIDNKLVLDWYIESDIDEYHIKPSNCIVCYIPNGFKDNKRNQKIFIKKKNYDSYETPKKFVDELDSYNGIQYLETYIAE